MFLTVDRCSRESGSPCYFRILHSLLFTLSHQHEEQSQEELLSCNVDDLHWFVFICRSFENNLKTYKLLAHRKPESELPTVSLQIKFFLNTTVSVSCTTRPESRLFLVSQLSLHKARCLIFYYTALSFCQLIMTAALLPHSTAAIFRDILGKTSLTYWINISWQYAAGQTVMWVFLCMLAAWHYCCSL